MNKFIYEDFVSEQFDNLLMNSRTVRQLVLQTFTAENGMAGSKIDNIYLAALYCSDMVLYEWWINISKDELFFLIRLPFYLPAEPKKAKACIELHNQAYKSENAALCQNGDYIIVMGQPCQVFVDEDGEIKICKIELWASQKMVQEFMSAICNTTAAAQLVIAYTHMANNVDSFNIGWLTVCNEKLMFLSVDTNPVIKIPGITISRYEPFTYPYFGLDGQKYTVAEDDENGQFLVREK